MTMKMVQSNRFLRSALCLVLGRKIGSKLFESRLIDSIYHIDSKQIPPPNTQPEMQTILPGPVHAVKTA